MKTKSRAVSVVPGRLGTMATADGTERASDELLRVLRGLATAGLVLSLAAGLTFLDGCAKKQEAETQGQEATEAQGEDVAESQPEPEGRRTEVVKTEVKKGDTVRVHYKGSLGDGTVFDESKPERPLVFVAGGGQMIPGFDSAVLGMKLNEEKTVVIPAADAYGPKNEALIRNVPKTSFPADFVPEVDRRVTYRDQMGRARQGKIVDISADSVMVDFNHFLAGEDLTFEIKVIGIE